MWTSEKVIRNKRCNCAFQLTLFTLLNKPSNYSKPNINVKQAVARLFQTLDEQHEERKAKKKRNNKKEKRRGLERRGTFFDSLAPSPSPFVVLHANPIFRPANPTNRTPGTGTREKG